MKRKMYKTPETLVLELKSKQMILTVSDGDEAPGTGGSIGFSREGNYDDEE